VRCRRSGRRGGGELDEDVKLRRRAVSMARPDLAYYVLYASFASDYTTGTTTSGAVALLVMRPSTSVQTQKTRNTFFL